MKKFNFLKFLLFFLVLPMCTYTIECDYDGDYDDDEHNHNVNGTDQQSIIDSIEALKAILENMRNNYPEMDTSEIEKQIENLEKLLEKEEACIPFYSIVIVRWDSNTLTVINNPANNGGYDFSDAQYQWYHNGKRLRNATGQSLLTNPDGGMLEAGHYHVEIRYRGGFLITCTEYCAFNNSN